MIKKGDLVQVVEVHGPDLDNRSLMLVSVRAVRVKSRLRKGRKTSFVGGVQRLCNPR